MIRRIAGLLAGAMFFAFAAPHNADAQLGKLREKVKERIDEKIDQKTDCALDEVFKDGKCAKKADPKGSTAGGAGASKGAAGAGKSSDKSSDKSPDKSENPDNDQDESKPASKAGSLSPGQGAWANYDFVPGDKILFAEDFTTDRVGNFPKRLDLDEGNFEVVEWNGRRWLRTNADGQFTVTLPQTLPERWTMEFEVTIPWSSMLIGTDEKLYANKNSIQRIVLSGTEVAGRNGEKGGALDPRDLFPDMYPDGVSLAAPMHVRVQADGNYMKVYVEERRVINMPNMGRWQGKNIRFWIPENSSNGKDAFPLITGLTINAGGKEMYDKLIADGRLAVQGIYFDVGSDRIRPESSGTLAEIAGMLKEHADLKLMVEGHTDNAGAADRNKALSEARAASVVKYLTGQGIDAARLKSVGFGDTRPAAPNDNPENRQKNRRVELVKM